MRTKNCLFVNLIQRTKKPKIELARRANVCVFRSVVKCKQSKYVYIQVSCLFLFSESCKVHVEQMCVYSGQLFVFIQ